MDARGHMTMMSIMMSLGSASRSREKSIKLVSGIEYSTFYEENGILVSLASIRSPTVPDGELKISGVDSEWLSRDYIYSSGGLFGVTTICQLYSSTRLTAL